MDRFYSPRVFRFLTIVFMVVICLIFGSLTNITWIKIELPKDHPEYNGYNATAVVYGRNGDVLYRMTSQKVWQYPSNEQIFMENLHTIVYVESQPSIVKYDLTSHTGWMNYNKKVGFLGESAVLVITNPDPKEVIKFYGRNVDLDLVRNYISSKDQITMVKAGSTVSGKGFNYDKTTGILHVLSNVEIVYHENKL